jgi:hypothetical protein
MPGAMDLGIANDGECSGHKKATQIAIALLTYAAVPLLAPHLSAVSEPAQSRPRNYALNGARFSPTRP